MNSYQENPIVQQRKWWILIAVSMFTFMSTLDGSIVNIALPTISADLGVPMNQVGRIRLLDDRLCLPFTIR